MYSNIESPPGSITHSPAGSSKRITLFVFGVLALFTLSDLFFVFRFGVNVPYFDEWDAIVPRLSGALPITAKWLWSQHNDHRLVLPRLLEIGLLRVTGGEYRALMALNVFLFTSSAAILIRLAARIRGSLRWTDAAFPILLLHIANYENLLWAVQIQVSLTEVCLTTLLYLAFTVTDGKGMSVRRAGLATLCLLVPPLCGAYGLPFTVLLSPWLFVRGLAARRIGGIAAGNTAIAGSVAGLVLACLYVIGFHRHSASPEAAGFSPVAFVRTIVEYMMTALGRGAALSGLRLTPAEGYTAPYQMSLFVVTSALTATAAAVFLFAARDGTAKRRRLILLGICLPAAIVVLRLLSARLLVPPATALILFPALLTPIFLVTLAFLLFNRLRNHWADRSAMLGPFLFVLALTALVVSVGVGRSSFGPGAALAGRYTAHSCLLLVCAYLVAEKYGSATQRKYVPIALLAATLAFLPNNIEEGMIRARAWHQGLQKFYSAAASGASVSALANLGAPVAHYRGVVVLHPTAEVLKHGIEQLRSARIAPFANVGDDPETRFVFLSVDAAVKAPDGSLTWALPQPVSVFGVEITYVVSAGSGGEPRAPESGSAGIGYKAEAVPANDPPAPSTPASVLNALLPGSGTLQFYPDGAIIKSVRIFPAPQAKSTPAPLTIRGIRLKVMGSRVVL